MYEDEDPLSNSMFGDTSILPATTTNSILGNTTMNSSIFSSSQYQEEDPWGNYSSITPITATTTTPNRSFTTPNLTSTQYNNTTSDAVPRYNNTTVLSGIRLPHVYQELFTQYQRSGRVSLSSLNTILSRGKISAHYIEQIMQIVVPDGASYVTQSEFNTSIALLACAQNKIDVSLESLYRNKNYLPEPIIHHIEEEEEQEEEKKQEFKSPLTITSHQIPEPTTKSNHTTSHGERGGGGGGYPGMKSPKTSYTNHHRNHGQQQIDNNSTTTAKKLLDTRHWFKHVEEITVTVAPEREGFIFKHVNYIVTNEKRSSIVLRRYSDFWWLLEVLLKRYPFRTLPNLPPKKLGGRDATFLEKRRKGLSRFINAIIRHPILRQDDLVNRFLTEPSELSAWRKQNPPTLEEEFRRKRINARELDDMTPANLDEHLVKARKRVTAGINHYVNLSFIMERMIRRMHGQATDFSRYSIALNSLAESELRYHAGECRNCQHVVKGYENVAKHMQCESSLLEDQVASATEGVLENLKRFRDLLVSFRDLDERRAKLSINQTELITKRIQTNRSKLHQHKGVPGLEVEIDKLEESIRADETELSTQQDRLVFIRFCMWSELIYLHKQQAFVSSLYQGYVKDSIHFSKLRADNWQDLESPTFEMPSDVDLFE